MHTLTKTDGTKVIKNLKFLKDEIQKTGVEVLQCEYLGNQFHLKLGKGFDSQVGTVMSTLNLIGLFIPKDYKQSKTFSCNNNSMCLIVQRL